MATEFMQDGPKILDLLSEERQTKHLWESACVHRTAVYNTQVINEYVTSV